MRSHFGVKDKMLFFRSSWASVLTFLNK